MKIAFIGYGNMATALADKWQKKHDLFFSGRTDIRAARVAARYSAKSGSTADAVAFADVVVLATRYQDALSVAKTAGGDAAFAGKIVVDINNPVDIETFTSTMVGTRSLTEAIGELLPGAEIVKAFNMAAASVWRDPDMSYDGRTLVTPYTADTEHAAAVIAELIEDVGSHPLHVGGTAHAYQLEAAAALVIKQLVTTDTPAKSVLNFIFPEGLPKAKAA